MFTKSAWGGGMGSAAHLLHCPACVLGLSDANSTMAHLSLVYIAFPSPEALQTVVMEDRDVWQKPRSMRSVKEVVAAGDCSNEDMHC